jgi:hypothetical protein
MNNANLTPEQASRLSAHLQQVGPEQEQDLGGMVSPERVSPERVSTIIPENLVDTKGDEIKRRIADLEKEYYGSMRAPSLDTRTTNYKDEYGNDTYYVKNISDGHVTVEKPDMVIPKGKVMDLLQFADMEDIHSCRDLRIALSTSSIKGPMLKRLTQREYMEEMAREVSIQRKVEIVRNQESIKRSQVNQNNQNQQSQMNPPQASQGPKIRPMILGKIEKLRLASDNDPENAKFGISSSEFIQWVMGEALSEEELDYILGDPVISNKHDIKAAVVEKKTIM